MFCLSVPPSRPRGRENKNLSQRVVRTHTKSIKLPSRLRDEKRRVSTFGEVVAAASGALWSDLTVGSIRWALNICAPEQDGNLLWGLQSLVLVRLLGACIQRWVGPTVVGRVQGEPGALCLMSEAGSRRQGGTGVKEDRSRAALLIFF